MLLILTEKPSVAKAFADALKVPRKDLFWENDNYCIVNALGHLLENYAPEDYDSTLKKWSLGGLPIVPEEVKFKPILKTKEQLAIVKICFVRHKNEPLLLATDAEREGELIGSEILNYVGFDNYKNAKRFWVSEALTPEVIRAGIESAKPLSEYASYKKQGFARQHADWLVGMNLTRLISLKSDKLLHFGRVQTALLGAIYKRDFSIKNFSPESYCEVKAVLKGEHQFSVKLLNPDDEEFPTRFPKSSRLIKEIESKKGLMKSGIISDINKEEKKELPPQLYNLTALQKEAHKKYSYSPEETLNLAQNLYEKYKCLSYPRTPSRVMGDDNVNLFKDIFNKLVDVYNNGSEYSVYLSGSDPQNITKENKRIFNSADLQDHHALIPLCPRPLTCSLDEANVYYLVFKRFFDVLKPPFIYNSITINMLISGHTFMGKGTEVLQSGWKTSHEIDDEDDKEPPDNYSGLKERQEYPVLSIDTEEKKTQPKKHYTFTSLLQLMENPLNEDGKRLTGLGTPATRGSILQKLVDRKYVSLKGKSVLITDDGKFLIENVLKNEELSAFISIPETTRWEDKLHENTAVFIDDIKNFVRRAVKNTDMSIYQQDSSSLGKCPLCAGNIYEGKKNYYCSNYKSDKHCRFTIWKEISAAAVTSTDVQALLSGKKTKVKKCVSTKTGKDFKAVFILNGINVEFRFEDKKK